MKFLSSCYLQQGENALSLLLQQYRYREVQVFFACVFMGEGENADRAGGYMAEQMLGWFRGLQIKKLYCKRKKEWGKLGNSIFEVIGRVDGELENCGIMAKGRKTGIAGVFCLAERYLLFCREAGRIYLLNTAFGYGHVRRILYKDPGSDLNMEEGIMEPDIGLLLTTEPFCRYATEIMLKGVLNMGETETQGQMDRRLGELAKEAERRGAAYVGAIFFRTSEKV